MVTCPCFRHDFSEQDHYKMSLNNSNFFLPMAQALPEVAAPGQSAEEPLVGPSARVILEQ